MALARCTGCGDRVPAAADRCPRCRLSLAWELLPLEPDDGDGGPVPPAPARGRATSAGRGRALAVAAVLATVVAVSLLSGPDPGPPTAAPRSTTNRPSPSPPPSAAPPSPVPAVDVPPGWERRSVGALTELADRGEHVAVSAGDRLVVWSRSAGATYDPVADRWRMMALAPIRHRQGAATAWTGREVLVWGGWREPGPAYAGDGAAYDPVADQWRVLPPAPLGSRVPVAGVWTGREMVVAGGHGPAGHRLLDAAAYDPAADAWRRLPDLPLALEEVAAAWTGREVLLYGAIAGGRGGAAVVAYDPEADAWRSLPPAPLDAPSTQAAWTGRELLAWDPEGWTAMYDPATGWWRPTGRAPVGGDCGDRPVLADGILFVSRCQTASAYRPGDGSWRVLPHPPGVLVQAHAIGGVVVLWAAEGSAPGTWVHAIRAAGQT